MLDFYEPALSLRLSSYGYPFIFLIFINDITTPAGRQPRLSGFELTTGLSHARLKSATPKRVNSLGPGIGSTELEHSLLSPG